ncbi:MAG: hypothetical protein GY842_07945 [bacterium]|nr:hypothetical protein [bacterium]
MKTIAMRPWYPGMIMAFGLAVLLAAASAAQEGSITQMNRRVLDVRRCQVELRAARADLERVQQLFAEGLTAQAELDRVRTSMETAQLRYQEAVLSLLSLQPRIAIDEAVKYRSADGRRFLRLTVSNMTPTFDDSQFRLLTDFEGAGTIPEELRTRDVKDIFISIKDTGGERTVPRGTTIAIPYEQHIPVLAYGRSATITFQFLRDANNVLVAASYLGQTAEIAIQLQQEETGSAVNVTSTQISQEADLGSQISYALHLDRSSVDVRSFQLMTFNLPRQITYSFIDPENEARLSQLNFPAGVTEQDLNLRLFLPAQVDGQVVLDEPLEFWTVITEDRVTIPEGETLTPDALQATGGGFLRLEVIPRGMGKIEVSAPSLFSEIRVGESVSSEITVKNTGTRRLDTVWLSAEAPLGWQATITPDVINSLEIKREETTRLTITPPPDVPIGDYEVRIKTESQAYNRQVPSEDKVYRLSVKPRPNVIGTSLIALALVALVLGAVAFGVKLTRR